MNETPITVLRNQIKAYDSFLTHIKTMFLEDELSFDGYNNLVNSITQKKKEFQDAIDLLSQPS